MSSTSAPGTESDPAGDLLAQVLGRPVHEQSGALAELCARFPAQAEELRARYAALAAIGLVDGAPAPPAGFPPRLREFTLVAQLGGGGMGVVYRAREEGLQREVALKLIRPEHVWFPGAHRWFRREVEAIASLQHEGIVPVYRAGEAEGIPYFVMELVDGITLAQAVRAVRAVVSGARAARPRHLAAAAGASAAADPTGVFVGSSWADACVRIVLQAPTRSRTRMRAASSIATSSRAT